MIQILTSHPLQKFQMCFKVIIANELKFDVAKGLAYKLHVQFVAYFR